MHEWRQIGSVFLFPCITSADSAFVGRRSTNPFFISPRFRNISCSGTAADLWSTDSISLKPVIHRMIRNIETSPSVGECGDVSTANRAKLCRINLKVSRSSMVGSECGANTFLRNILLSSATGYDCFYASNLKAHV